MINKEKLQKQFENHFGDAATELSFAPGRINLIGEHVDYLGGKVLPAAIDKGVSAIGKTNDSDIIRIYAADMQQTCEWKQCILNDSCPPGWQAYIWGVLKELFKLDVPWKGADLLIAGDLPKGSGLSSSAALEVATAQFFLSLSHKTLPSLELTQIAHRAETLHVGTNCGIMDQYASVHGKEDHFMILDCSLRQHEYVKVDSPEYCWLLINSMVSHDLGDEYNSIRRKSENDKSFYANGEFERTKKFIAALTNNNMKEAGKLLTETHWALSQKLKVSTPELDALITIANDISGWLGGRMMGGGFGGCTLNLIAKEQSEKILSNIKRGFEEKFKITPDVYEVTLSQGCFSEKLD